jgi:flagellar motor switch protein FliM
MDVNNLSREKIHRLLAAIGSAAPDNDSNVQAVEYDWHQPHYFTTNQLKNLDRFTTNLAAAVAKKFGALCQSSFEVTIASTTQHFAGHFLGQAASNPQPTQGIDNYYLAFTTAKDYPCGFVSIPPQTALVWATQLLGEPESKDAVNRVLSKLEESLLLDMALLIVESLTEADPNCSVRPRASAITNHMPLELKGTEEFCKITFDVKKTGPQTASQAHVLVLCEALSQVVGETSLGENQLLPKDTSKAMLGHVEKMPVFITAQLATVALTLEQIIGLSPDDLLILDKKVNEPIELIVEGRTLCRGRTAQAEGNYAFAVAETLFNATQSTQ